ncbi:MAG: hypothetical protein AAB877_01505 [Patescibacteria group bacterium]
MKHKKLKNGGFIFLEILIAVALISIVFILMVGIGFQSLNISASLEKSSKADSFLKEEMEAVRSFRDGTTWATNGLGSALTGTANPYHLVLDTATNPPKWVLATGAETINIFTRKVVFDKVSRNPSSQNIESAYNSANDDPKTSKATATVSWEDKSLELIAYFTNWKE